MLENNHLKSGTYKFPNETAPENLHNSRFLRNKYFQKQNIRNY